MNHILSHRQKVFKGLLDSYLFNKRMDQYDILTSIYGFSPSSNSSDIKPTNNIVNKCISMFIHVLRYDGGK